MLGKMEEMEVEQDKKGWEEATVLNVPLFYQLMRRQDRVGWHRTERRYGTTN